MKALCIISGGMDSAVATAIAKKQGYEILALHFDYSQRTQNKEKECFLKLCKDFGAKSFIFDANFIAQIGGSALTDFNIKIPKNNNLNAKKSKLPTTYVPFRNGIFIAIAVALAQKENCDAIFLGVVEEDSSGYPDCSDDFIQKFQATLQSGTRAKISLFAPLVHKNKEEIVKLGLELGVDFSHTYSCYESEVYPCKTCDSCKLRAKGFKMTGVKDPIL